jgi:hypothetical protein
LLALGVGFLQQTLSMPVLVWPQSNGGFSSLKSLKIKKKLQKCLVGYVQNN